MAERQAFLPVILFCFFAAMTIEAAEWSKFKTCSDLGFCRRQRDYRSTDQDSYNAISDSVSLVELDGRILLVGHLQRRSEPEPMLRFAVSAIDPGMFRMSIASLKPEIHTRYEPEDVIMDDVKYLRLSEEALSRTSTYVLLTVGGSVLKITYVPFKVELLEASSPSAPALVNINEGSRLFYDIHRMKPEPPQSPEGSPSPVEGEAHALDNANSNDISAGGSVKETIEDGWGETFQSHHDPMRRGPESIGADISFPFADVVHGLPGRTVAVSLPHTKTANGTALTEPYRMYNLDVFEFELDKTLGLYGAIPFVMGRKGGKSAAVLWLNSAETYVDISPRDRGGVRSHWFSESGTIDIYLISGPNLNSVFDQYRMLTGPPAMPQRFSLGYHQCRWNYRDDQDVRTVDAGFEKHDIPYDVMWLDIEHTHGKRYFTWDMERFPDPTKLQNDLAVRGRKMVTIIDPHIKRDNKYSLHRFATENKYYVMKPDGKPYDGWCWPGSASYFDFSSPVVREAWASRFNPTDYPHFTEHLYTWVDMNEPSVFNGPEGTMPKDLIHANNVEHRHLHNIYGHYVQRATYEGLLKGHGGNDRPFVLSRSFFAGSQRYGTIWTGDNTASWGHLASSVRTIIPMQLSGMVFSGADVGGFFGNPNGELLLRWYQVGAFQPFFRGHGHLDTERREPWLFGDDITIRIAEAVRTRYSFLPFWYTLFAGNALANIHPFATETRGPPMRPVWWEFSSDPRAEAQDLQWLVGSSLLIDPVFEEGASSKTVYLPSNEIWFDLFDIFSPGKSINGGQHITISTPLDRMVVFQRGGSIIPRQYRRRRSTAAMAKDPITLVIAPDSKGEAFGELYMDDGKSFDYKSGAFTLTKFTFSKQKGLEAKVAAGRKMKFVGSDTLVERIVIMGMKPNEVRSVSVDSADGRQVEFEYSPDGHMLIIRKPEVKCGANWRLTFS